MHERHERAQASRSHPHTARSCKGRWRKALCREQVGERSKLYGCTIEELLADDVDEVEDQ